MDLSKNLPSVALLVNGFLLISLFGCATTYKITTIPAGANVYNNEEKLLGVTPLEITEKDFPSGGKDGNGVVVRIEEKGYKRLWLWMPRNSKKYQVNINLAFLHPLKNQEQEELKSSRMKRSNLSILSDRILDIQTKLLLSQKVDDKAIADIKNDNPTLGVIYYLEGIQLLSQNKSSEALASLRKAVDLSPEEEDFLTLYNEVQSTLPSQATINGPKAQ